MKVEIVILSYKIPERLRATLTTGEHTYEVLAVRFATRVTLASHVYLNFHTYGEDDHEIRMDYFFWVARNRQRTVLVDTGFTPGVAHARARTITCPVPEALARLEVDPEQVDEVIISHAHWDHTGNLPLFPRARVTISGRELDFWTDPIARRQQFAQSCERADIKILERLAAQGRITRVAERHEVAPGIEVVEVGGHTPGQLVVLIDAEHKPVMLASDAVHYVDEVNYDRPFSVVTDLPQMYRAYDAITAMTSGAGAVLVAGHDPGVLEQFDPVDPTEPEFAVRVG